MGIRRREQDRDYVACCAQRIWWYVVNRKRIRGWWFDIWVKVCKIKSSKLNADKWWSRKMKRNRYVESEWIRMRMKGLMKVLKGGFGIMKEQRKVRLLRAYTVQGGLYKNSFSGSTANEVDRFHKWLLELNRLARRPNKENGAWWEWMREIMREILWVYIGKWLGWAFKTDEMRQFLVTSSI